MISLSVLGELLPSPEIFGAILSPYRILVPVYILFLFAYVVQEKELEVPKSLLLLVFFLVLSSFSFLWAKNPEVAIRGAGRMTAKGILGVGIVLTANDRRTLYHYSVVVLGLAVIGLIFSGFELVSGFHLHTSKYVGRDITGRFGYYTTAWFYNVNDYAFFLGLAAVYPLALVIQQKTSVIVKTASAIFLLGTLLILVNIGARAGLVSILISLITVVIFAYDVASHKRTDFIFSNRTVSVFLASVTTALIFLVTFFNNPFSVSHTSLFLRWQLQAVATNIGVSYPFGVGIGNVSSTIISSGEVLKDIGAPHSWYGTTIASLGIPGLVLLVLLFARVIGGTCRKAIQSSDPIAIGIAGWILTVPISTLGPSNAMFLPTFWIGIGFGIAVIKNYPVVGGQTAP
jgi:hypothetical protein